MIERRPEASNPATPRDLRFDWRNKTCGECGWFKRTISENSDGLCKPHPARAETSGATHEIRAARSWSSRETKQRWNYDAIDPE